MPLSANDIEMEKAATQNGTEVPREMDEMDSLEAEHRFHTQPPRRMSKLHPNKPHKQLKTSWLQAILAIIILLLVVIIVVLLGVMFSRNNQTEEEPLTGDENSTLLNQTGQAEPVSLPRVDVRLPENVLPLHYDLTLQPFLEPGDFRFEGSVKISILTVSKSSSVTLHAKDLEIDANNVTVVDDVTGETIDVAETETDERRQFFIVHLSEVLLPNQTLDVTLTFRGKLRDDLTGLYLSQYTDSNGDKQYLATTQFQPTDARKAFPCFDEPKFKATFTVTLVRRHDMLSLSNTEIETKIRRPDGWVADKYEKTLKMSTYLLAFIVCNFSSKESVSKSGIKVRVWSKPESIEQTNYALQVGTQTLTYFEDYFQIRFPLKKLDIVGVPQFAFNGMENWGLIICNSRLLTLDESNPALSDIGYINFLVTHEIVHQVEFVAVPDVSFSAMENWGLITFRESKMLFENDVSSLANQEYVLLAVCHELAHQWFGNLVTPVWWDDLWLNEGFASYLAQIGIQETEPASSVDERLIRREMQRAMVTDSLTTSHPIFATVSDPEEIGEIFDDISYSKGASIVRMMSYFLGSKVFKSGLKKYLKDNEYDNAVTDDLWNAMSEVAMASGTPVDVKEVLDAWTKLTGYPVVTLNVSSSGTVTANQERFLLDKTAEDLEKSVWPVPLTIVTSDQVSASQESQAVWSNPRMVWLKDNEMTLDDVNVERDGWVLGNVYRQGYFRVNYNPENWEGIISSNMLLINPLNRAQLIDDAFWLARAGYVDQTIPLRLTQYMDGEVESLPWELLLNTLHEWYGLLAWSRCYGDFKRYVLLQSAQMYTAYGWNEEDGEDMATRHMRIKILEAACKFGNVECNYQANLQYNMWMRNQVNEIKANFREFVYCTAIHNGNVGEWDFAWDNLGKTRLANERAKLLNAMGCSKEPWILNRYLQLALESEDIRGSDVVKVISSVAKNPVGRYFSWRFAIKNWDKIRRKYGENEFVDRRLIKGLTKYFSTPAELSQLEDFVNSLGDLGGSEQRWKQAIEKTRANVNWLSENEATIGKWFAEKIR